MRRILLSFAFLGLASVASAQQVGAGWSAFAGCWTPVSANGDRNIAANTPRVCVVPNANGTSADLVTIVSELAAGQRTPIDASGQRTDVSKQGCSGWEKAEFSSDGRRLYLKGEQTCAGGLKRNTSGIFALTASGDMVNVVDVSADSVSSVRVSRYAASSVLTTFPTEIRDALQSREASDRTARISAQREVSIDAVIEATRYLTAPTVEAWLAELEQGFNLDEKTLVRLADENVPPSVIDVLVAVSNPKQFSVRGTGTIEQNAGPERPHRDPYAPCFAPVVDPWAWYAYDPCDPYLRYSYYRPLYGRYGYPYGLGYGGYGYGYNGYYGSPVVIIAGGSRSHGRMTKDGYKSDGSTSGGSTSSGGSSGRTATSKGSGSSGSGSSSSGSGSSGSSGSSSSGNGGRTATRKPPTSDQAPPPIPRAPVEMRDRAIDPGPSASSSSSSSSGSSGSTGGDGGRVATRKPPA